MGVFSRDYPLLNTSKFPSKVGKWHHYPKGHPQKGAVGTPLREQGHTETEARMSGKGILGVWVECGVSGAVTMELSCLNSVTAHPTGQGTCLPFSHPRASFVFSFLMTKSFP